MRVRVLLEVLPLVTLACVVGCRSRALDPTGSGTIALDGGGAGGDSGGSGASGAAGAGGGIGTPRPRFGQGEPCASNADCDSGHCVDGVCCAGDCVGSCYTCAAPGTVGTCVARPAGRTPRSADACGQEDIASVCGNDGLCDGAGHCRLRLANTPCGAGHCDGDAVVGARVCDGFGSCRPAATQICVPYRCDPATAACRDDCATDVDCPGSTCESGGRCHLGGGQSCNSGSECASAWCMAGVCCNSSCQDPCMACNLPGRQGTCSPRPEGCPGADAGSD
jgi:hypothetical protein